MKVSTMRRLDRWVGIPACALLSLWRRLLDWRRVPQSYRRILFIKPAEQGATVLADAAARRAADRVGRDNVYFLVFRENRFVLDAMELVPRENIFTLDTTSLVRFAFSTLATLRSIHRTRIDAAVDLEFFTRASALLTYLSGARIRVGMHPSGDESGYRGDLMTHRANYNPRLHTSQMYEVLVRALDTPGNELPAVDWSPPPPQPPKSHYLPGDEKIKRVSQLLRDTLPDWQPLGEEGSHSAAERMPLVLLNANASDLLPLRRWAPARYVELARRLLSRFPRLAIAFTGSPAERPVVEPLVAEVANPRCVSLAGRTTLSDLLTLYHLADVLVTNDSGPAHFATLTPIDVVTLFGPETPKLFGALGPRVHILYAHLACSPCVNAYNHRTTRCRRAVCMERISVDAVFDAVVAALERRTPPG